MNVLPDTSRGINVTFKAAAGLFVALLLTLGLQAAVASAASTHTPVTEWSTGSDECGPRAVATDKADNVYVVCTEKQGTGNVGSVRKFSSNGTPIPFEKAASYISNNELTGDPGNSEHTCVFCQEEVPPQFGSNAWIAIDKSSARPGYIYVAASSTFSFGGSSQAIDVFAPSGEYVTSIRAGIQDGSAAGVDIGPNGDIYVQWEGGQKSAHVSKYSPVDFHEVERWNPGGISTGLGTEDYSAACCSEVKVDNTGATWVGWGNSLFDSTGPIGKVEADQWTKDLIPGPKDPNLVFAHTSPFLYEAFPETECPEFQNKPSIGGENMPCYLFARDFDTDQSNNDLYAVTASSAANTSHGNQITPYSEGKPGDPVHQDGPIFGKNKFGSGSGRHGIDVSSSGAVYVTNFQEDKIVRFARGETLPTVTTHPAAIPDIGHEEALLRGIVNPEGGNGGGQIEHCEVMIKPIGTPLPETGTPGDGVACNEATPYPNSGAKDVTATVTGLEATHRYHYRFEAANSAGENLGGERIVEAKAVLDVETKPAPPEEIERNQVTLEGQLDPDNLPTEYWYEYGPDKNYGLSTEKTPISGTGIKPTPFVLGHLQAGKNIHYRLAASNATYGTTRGQDEVVRTASSPEITGVGSENVEESSADLHLSVNPVGFDTTYVVKYGTSTAYGNTIPGSGENIGSGTEPIQKNLHLEGLPPNATIHYKVFATNKWGTTETDDTTFTFRPPTCPNSHVRQLTSSSYLPDCRAYELVTPGYAGAVQILPGEALAHFGEGFGTFAQGPQDFGFASNPGRFAYMGALGAVNGTEAVNGFIDMYLSTRTSRGWITTFPNLKGSETSKEWGFACSESMALCVSHIGELQTHNEETGNTEYTRPQNSPYLYRADGARLMRLPTNVNTVPGGTTFEGDQMLSGDFSHYVLSTTTPFVPGGPTTEPGAVYDNDIAAKSIQIASQTPGGEIPQLVHDGRPTGIAAVSSDGSHILMAATTSKSCTVFEYGEYGFRCPYILGSPAIFYERVNGAVTREVSKGELAHFVGMTHDGSKVDFTTTAKLVPEDKDNSSDMYQYNADTDEWTLVSQVGNLGKTDGCSATWTEGCGVEAITPERISGSEGYETTARTPGPDDQIAYGDGDVYFYAPEDLQEGEVGADGQRNLYLYRKGTVRFVATLEPGTEIERATISGDGGHAAFMTKSSLTSYNSEKHDEVYAYNADTNVLRCASCNPSGAKPASGSHVVSVSEAGPFMSNDGRVFFASKESLVPQDTDGIRDIYEYTEGHAQLISSGTGDRDSTGGLETVSFFFGNTQTGLESVSRDGSDVFFSTFESLVPDDKNGSFVKIYDARTNGGFDFTPELGSCAAADECHGVGSEPPPPPEVATGGTLGGGGNLPPSRSAKHNKKRHKRHHKKHKRHGRHARAAHHRSGTNG